jgi:hypothetical protein
MVMYGDWIIEVEDNTTRFNPTLSIESFALRCQSEPRLQ